MYDGYMALGGELISDERVELINNTRVSNYVYWWNQKVRQGTETGFQCIEWWNGAPVCEVVDNVFDGGSPYVLPELDPAPWYDASVPGSERFFGFVGLEIEGDDGVTRVADVQQSIVSGGYVGRANNLAREVTVRALAVAADGTGLAAGLAWMRENFAEPLTACDDDYLWFLTACPDCGSDPVANGGSGGPCWATTMAELETGPASCAPGVWWPSTIGEFTTGPPPPSDPIQADEWCTWIPNMQGFVVGVLAIDCDPSNCAELFVNQFRRVRIIEGPEVISKQHLSDGALLAEVEYVVVAADPDHYQPLAGQVQLAPTALFDFSPDQTVSPEKGSRRTMSETPNPFGVRASSRSEVAPPTPDMPDAWDRQVVEFWAPSEGQGSGFMPKIALHAKTETLSDIRVSVLDHTGNEMLGGWYIPQLPEDGVVVIDGPNQRVVTEWRGEQLPNRGHVLNFDGTPNVKHVRMVAGARYLIALDAAKGTPKRSLSVMLGGVQVKGTR